jgi:hypothetical protein
VPSLHGYEVMGGGARKRCVALMYHYSHKKGKKEQFNESNKKMRRVIKIS